MPVVIPADALVLVVILPSPRDLEIARLLGWYRIPLRWAPKVIDVDYLAFYQTAAFGEHGRWQIRFTAQVLGHELTTRGDLLREEQDHPRAGEEYFKIQVGSLQELPNPVMAGRWRRITFLYTTGAYLNKASQLTDLVVRAEERQLLWSSLRERAVQSGQYTAEARQPEIDQELLALLQLSGFATNPPGLDSGDGVKDY